MAKKENKTQTELRLVLDATPFPVALVDLKDKKIEYWSRSAKTLFGHTPLTTLEWYKKAYPNPAYRRKVISQWKSLLKSLPHNGKAHRAGEYEVTCHNGKIRLCELYATFINDRLIVTFNDITDRKIYEDRLRLEQSFTEATMQSLPGIFYVFDEKGRFTKWNKYFEQVTGYSEKEIQKLSLHHFFDKPDKKTIALAIRKAFKEGKALVEAPLKTKNGVKIPYLFSGYRMLQGGKLFLVGMGLDRTQKREAEVSLIKEKERFQALYESSRDAIMTLEPPTWGFTSGNPSTIEMFCCDDEKDFISRGPWHYSPPRQSDGKPSGPKAKAMIMKAMKEGSNFFEWTHRRKTGEDFPASVLLTRLTVGGKTFLQATVRDISHRKEIEKQVSDKIEQLEFSGRVGIKRFKEMMELKKENEQLKKKLEKYES